MKAYLFSLDAVRKEVPPHELPFYLSSRLAARAWQLMFFKAARFKPDPAQSTSWNRGAYLVRHLGHCGECHTPRGRLGALLENRELSGNPSGPDGKAVPDITTTKADGIGDWSTRDIVYFLDIGMLPDGDFAGGVMARVIDDNTSHLTADDREAIAVYLLSLPGRSSRD
jgi:mono/diheme cytochrome c family protein